MTYTALSNEYDCVFIQPENATSHHLNGGDSPLIQEACFFSSLTVSSYFINKLLMDYSRLCL